VPRAGQGLASPAAAAAASLAAGRTQPRLCIAHLPATGDNPNRRTLARHQLVSRLASLAVAHRLGPSFVSGLLGFDKIGHGQGWCREDCASAARAKGPEATLAE